MLTNSKIIAKRKPVEMEADCRAVKPPPTNNAMAMPPLFFLKTNKNIYRKIKNGFKVSINETLKPNESYVEYDYAGISALIVSRLLSTFFNRPCKTLPGPTSMYWVMPSAIICCMLCVHFTGAVN